MIDYGIYKLIDNKEVPLTASEIKSEIMKIVGLKTSKEYENYYDAFRNRVRAFEQFSGEHIEHVNAFLYLQAKAMERHGENYTPSEKMQIIMSMPSISSGSKLSEERLERALKDYGRYIDRRFAGLIAKDDTAKYISDNISDVTKRAAALIDYANKLNEKRKALRKKKGASSISESVKQAYIDASADFDINAYLD